MTPRYGKDGPWKGSSGEFRIYLCTNEWNDVDEKSWLSFRGDFYKPNLSWRVALFSFSAAHIPLNIFHSPLSSGTDLTFLLKAIGSWTEELNALIAISATRRSRSSTLWTERRSRMCSTSTPSSARCEEWRSFTATSATAFDGRSPRERDERPTHAVLMLTFCGGHYSAAQLSTQALKGLRGYLLDLTQDSKSYISCFAYSKTGWGKKKITASCCSPRTALQLHAANSSSSLGAQCGAVVSSKPAYVRLRLFPSLPSRSPRHSGNSRGMTRLCQQPGTERTDTFQKSALTLLKVTPPLRRKGKQQNYSF